jgi:hypothetical protein
VVYRIANFGDGKINAFDINSGNFIAPLKNRRGEPLDFNGLWALFLWDDMTTRFALMFSASCTICSEAVPILKQLRQFQCSERKSSSN